MRRIKSDELPEWFDLSKYESAKDLDLAGWHINLSKRFVTFRLATSKNNHFRSEFEEFTSSGELLVVFPPVKGRSGGRLGPDPNYSGTQHSELNQASVCSLPAHHCARMIADALEEESELSAGLLSAAQFLVESKDFEDFSENYPFWADIWEQPIDILRKKNWGGDFLEQNLLIEVDMFAPDSLIVEDFKKWLSAAREVFDMESKNLFTAAAIRSWATNRVLAFIDLTTWAKFQGVRIPNPVMGAALFPDDYDVSLSERITKVVRPKAMWLTRLSVIGAIRTQSLEQE